MNHTILLIGHGSRNMAAVAEYKAFAAEIGQRLQTKVEPCFLEFADPPIAEAIEAVVNRGETQIVAIPLFLGPAGHQKNDVPAVINWAKQRWPQVTFRYGTPLGAQYHIVNVLAARLENMMEQPDQSIRPEETAVLLVSRGSRDPDANGEAAKLARLLYEGRSFHSVDPAYYALTTPGIDEMVRRTARSGAKRVVLLPYLLFTGRIHERVIEQGEAAAEKYGINVVTAPYLYPHPELTEAVVTRYTEAAEGLAKMTCDLCKYRRKMVGFEEEYDLPQTSDPSHGFRGIPVGHDIEQKIDDLLPEAYSNGNAPSADPMASADLAYAEDGSIAWDEIWEGYCDLALAGGPSHRGELLEPADREIVLQYHAAYEIARDEIERGIRQVTNLEVIRDCPPGWIGMRCHSEEMAVWLLRAIIAENVMVRRQGADIYLPAGPDFRLKYEIKNVVTVVAKTVHYWMDHMRGKMARKKKAAA
ncbi:MAG: sirohydrochlorin chelatase [Chloroflexota bacterium]